MELHTKGRRLLIAILISGSLGLITFGLFRGEATDIYLKGISICLACIGIA
jgi:hypothetical protein